MFFSLRTRLLRHLLVVLAGVMAAPWTAVADDPPATKDARAKRAVPVAQRVRSAAQDEEAKKEQDSAPSCHAPDTVPEPKVNPSGSQPIAKCAKLEVSPEPVWAGKDLSATWVLKNEGQANLSIKIKGG